MAEKSSKKLIYYLVIAAALVLISAIGYKLYNDKNQLNKSRVTRLLSREWRIDAFEDLETNEITTAEGEIINDRFIFYPDGRALIIGKASGAFTWYYTEKNQTITLNGMDEDSTETQQKILAISKDKVVMQTPQVVVHMVPVETKVRKPE